MGWVSPAGSGRGRLLDGLSTVVVVVAGLVVQQGEPALRRVRAQAPGAADALAGLGPELGAAHDAGLVDGDARAQERALRVGLGGWAAARARWTSCWSSRPSWGPWSHRAMKWIWPRRSAAAARTRCASPPVRGRGCIRRAWRMASLQSSRTPTMPPAARRSRTSALTGRGASAGRTRPPYWTVPVVPGVSQTSREAHMRGSRCRSSRVVRVQSAHRVPYLRWFVVHRVQIIVRPFPAGRAVRGRGRATRCGRRRSRG